MLNKLKAIKYTWKKNRFERLARKSKGVKASYYYQGYKHYAKKLEKMQ